MVWSGTLYDLKASLLSKTQSQWLLVVPLIRSGVKLQIYKLNYKFIQYAFCEYPLSLLECLLGKHTITQKLTHTEHH